MYRFLLVLFFFAASSTAGFAQTLSKVDLTKVYATIEDEASPFFYPALMKRYLANDTSLTLFEYHYLYYGFTKQPEYNPYGRNASQVAAAKLLEEGKKQEAKDLLLADFKKSPFNLSLIFRLGSLADQEDNGPEARLWLLKFEGLLRTILMSGDGQSEETAWVVITAQDEYPIMGMLGLEAKSQRLLKSKYDVQTLKTPNEMEAEKLYFNIEMPFGHIARSLTKETTQEIESEEAKKSRKTKAIGKN